MKKLFILIAIGSIACVSACRKNTKAFDGPSIQDIFSEFKLLSNFKANKDSVNFSSGQTVVFTADFNKVAEWTIDITGLNSKAIKTIKGTSKTIDATNATWNGSTSMLPMFAAENCKVVLKIKDVVDSFILNEKIIDIKKNAGFVIADFETGLQTKWVKYFQSGANMDCAVKTDSLTPEGKKYLNMAGIVNWDYLIGLIDFPATAYGTANTFPLTTNAEALYFNVMIYGVPNTNPSIVLFQLREDENANGIFDDKTEDEYDYEIKVDWEGWKLVSVRYSDLVTLVNGQPGTPKGNGLRNPDKLSKISLLHLANPANGFANAKLDYLIFTENAPLQP
jgi:Carbohydrate binding domain (family 11)